MRHPVVPPGPGDLAPGAEPASGTNGGERRASPAALATARTIDGTTRPVAGPNGPVKGCPRPSGPRAGPPHGNAMLDDHPGTDRLILVSDDPAASDALAAHLTRHGFVLVGQVSSAEAARIAARYTEPDVVLVDAAIRGGWRAVVEALDGVLESRRIAVLASYWGADERREATASGIGAAILKAVEGGALALRLREIAGHA